MLEGINRRTVLDLACDMGIRICERAVDLTELYIADEAFASGTSAFVTPIKEIDSRVVGDGRVGPLTARIAEKHRQILHGGDDKYSSLLTLLHETATHIL